MKRLGIFVFYDSEGVVDQYIEYLLDNLIEGLSRLIIVCNGTINDVGFKKLKKYTKEIVIRDNTGFDGWAYKCALLDKLDRDEVQMYDELILLNDTFFGPFSSFDTIFKKMDDKDCDIWGLSKHPKYKYGDIIRSEHLQSYFLVIRNTVLKNEEFWDFWNNIEKPVDFESAVSNFEISFSEAMLNAGYKLEAFSELKEYISNDPAVNYNYCSLNSGEMIINANYPIIKKKSLIVCNQDNRSAEIAYDYITNKTDYNPDYIWQNILRRFNLEDIRNGVGLNRQIANVSKSRKQLKDACICIFVNDRAILDDFNKYYMQLKDKIDFVFIINDVSIDIREYTNERLTIYNTDSDNIYSFLLDKKNVLDNYNYIGIYADPVNFSKVHRHIKYKEHDRIYECLFGGGNYIKNIVSLLSKNKYLGICYSIISSSLYSRDVKNDNYLNIMNNICNNSKDKLKLDNEHGLVLGTDSFWCKKSVLNKILYYIDKYNIVDNELECFIKMAPYYLQSKGFYINYVYNINYASRLLSNSYSIIKELKIHERKNNDEAFLRKVNEFCDCKLYIYGCGLVGTKYAEILRRNFINIEAFIVSDDQKKEETYMGNEVIKLSEYDNSESNAIIVGVGKKLYREVLSNLKKYNIKNIIQIY